MVWRTQWRWMGAGGGKGLHAMIDIPLSWANNPQDKFSYGEFNRGKIILILGIRVSEQKELSWDKMVVL